MRENNPTMGMHEAKEAVERSRINKPREWWIDAVEIRSQVDGPIGDVYCGPKFTDLIHVVEYSALEQANARIAELEFILISTTDDSLKFSLDARVQLTKLQRIVEVYEGALELVRSQMCWDRDRDQLSTGMCDLHASVTEALSTAAKIKCES